MRGRFTISDWGRDCSRLGRDGGAGRRGELRLGGSKLTKNAAREVLINFIMARDRLANLCLWLLIPVVLAAVPDEEGPSLFYFLD